MKLTRRQRDLLATPLAALALFAFLAAAADRSWAWLALAVAAFYAAGQLHNPR